MSRPYKPRQRLLRTIGDVDEQQCIKCNHWFPFTEDFFCATGVKRTLQRTCKKCSRPSLTSKKAASQVSSMVVAPKPTRVPDHRCTTFACPGDGFKPCGAPIVNVVTWLAEDPQIRAKFVCDTCADAVKKRNKAALEKAEAKAKEEQEKKERAKAEAGEVDPTIEVVEPEFVPELDERGFPTAPVGEEG